MSTFAYEAPEDYSPGGDFLNVEGWFHCLVESIECPPLDKNGGMISNGAFRVKFGILAGTVDGQYGKNSDEVFFHPKLDKPKKSQDYAKKRIGRMLRAISLDDGTAGGQKEVDLDLAPSRQFYCKIDKTEDGKYTQIAFAEIYHVDDPEVASYPKNDEMLKGYQFRLKPSTKASKANGGEFKAPVEETKVSVDDL